MSSIEVKTFDNPDESNSSFKNAKIDIVKVIHMSTKCCFGCSRFDSLLIQLQTQNTTS